MSKLSCKILDKIKKENVTPKSRHYFMLIHTLLGTAILTSIIFGAIAIAIVIRHFTLTDWELARLSAGGHLQSFFMLIPYIWLVFIGITILLADLLFRHTKKGHRIQPWKLAIGSVVISIVLGGLFYIVEADRPIEESLERGLPPYAQWQQMRNEMFAAPEKGVLAGVIIEMDSGKEWIVIDFKNNEWIVDISGAKMRSGDRFEIGMRTGMVGKMIDNSHFVAIRIGPWKREMRPPVLPKEILKEINERNF